MGGEGVVFAADGGGALLVGDRCVADGVLFADVAGVAELGDLAEGFALAAAADEDGGIGGAGWGFDLHRLDAEVGSGVGEGFGAPDAFDDGEGFVETALAVGDRWEGEVEGAEFGLHPAGADAEDEATAAEVVEVGGEAGEVGGVAVPGAVDGGAEADAAGGGGETGEGDPGIGVDGGVVEDEEGVVAEGFDEAAGVDQLGEGVVVVGDDELDAPARAAIGFGHPGVPGHVVVSCVTAP